MPRLIAVILLVLGSTGLAAPAHAESETAQDEAPEAEIIGILHIEIDGLAEAAAGSFEKAIEDAISGQGFKVAPRQRLSELLLDSPYVEGCLFGPCLAPIHRVTELRLVLVARIVAVGSSYSLVVSLMDTRTGRPASQVAEECAVCTLEEAVSSVTLAVIALVTGTGTARVPDAEGDPTRPPDLDAMRSRIETLEDRNASGGRTLRRAALFFGGAALVAGGASAYLFSRDRDDLAYGSAGVAGAFALTGATMLVLSRRF